MAISVNLLKKRRGISEKQYAMERQFLRYSVVFFLIILAVSLAFFAWQFITSRRTLAVQDELTQARARLQGLQDASSRQVYLKNRLQLIDTYFEETVSSREALQHLFSLDLPGVAILDASFESDSLLSVRMHATNVLTLEDVFLYFQRDDNFFTQAVNDGVTRLEDGTYTMQISLTVPQGVTP